MSTSKGTLSVISTPIGNLEDITFRAVRILKECEYILCEDTRVTRKLLDHYSISNQLVRYDAHMGGSLHDRVLADIASGARVALVSDAGTPCISDPGSLLIQAVFEHNLHCEVIPGPSAVTAALAIAPIQSNTFTFLGFIPQKKGRKTFIENLSTYHHAVVFYESTHRIVKLLEQIDEYHKEQKMCICRELTKMYEEVLVGTASHLLEKLYADTKKQKGEFVVIFTNE